MSRLYQIKQSDAGVVLLCDDLSLPAIAESGQCFRLTACAGNRFRLIAKGHCLEMEMLSEGERGVRFFCSMEEFETVWRPYFDLDADYALYRGAALSDDAYLMRAMDYGLGIRILRQEPFETLISFIVSQRRSVPAIRTAVEKLSAAFGEQLRPGVYAFPTPEALAAAPLEKLSGCGLGYRTGFVSEAARAVYTGRLDLSALSLCPTEELILRLEELHGVGIKVASCIALFGYHRLCVAPVDVWMDRILKHAYNGCFPAAYADCAGVLQQYLFYYARTERHI